MKNSIHMKSFTNSISTKFKSYTMKFLEHVVALFSKKSFKKLSIANQTILYDSKFDIGLREYYRYILQLLQNSLLALPELSTAQTIILGISKYPQNAKKTNRYIDFQVEHVLVKPSGRGAEKAPLGKTKVLNETGFYTVRIQNIDQLLHNDMILEYSRPNIKHIQQSDLYPEYLSKVCVISPTLYELKPNTILNLDRRKNTITLFRNVNEPRRKNFLESLSELNIPSENVNNVFEHLHLVYEDTKILINIHQTDEHHTLEELRVLPALRCGVIVVSEDSPLKEYSRIRDFVIWGTMEQLPRLIQDVQEHYEHYHRQLFTPHFFRRMERLEKSNRLRMKRGLQTLLH